MGHTILVASTSGLLNFTDKAMLTSYNKGLEL